jgi:hypothetical protein
MGAFPYLAVVPGGRDPNRVPLPIDSPTLLTRRRYDPRGSLKGFVRGGTLAEDPTGRVQKPWNGQGSVWPQWPHLMGSDVGIFLGSITGLEQNPNLVKMPIGFGADFLVTIAHRSPLTGVIPPQAIRPGRDMNVYMRARGYSLPYQIASPQAPQSWPSSSQWLAGQMPGTS